MSRRALLRLGLFQMTAGGLSVLFLGVLNRVMRVELGMDLFVISLLIGGGHYLGALVAIPFGFFSDTHPIAGYRRTIYILCGAFVTASILVASPWMGLWLAQSVTSFKLLLGFLFFLLEGISTYIAGTAYLALIADRTTESERGQATGLVWTMLFVGIIATAISTSIALRVYTIDGLVTLFSVAGVLAVMFSLIALLGQERRRAAGVIVRKERFSDAFRLVTRSRQTRWFASFLLLSMFSLFMQDVILEPFGGEVFGLSAAVTTRFNAYMGVGLIAAMLFGGMYLIPKRGKPWVTTLGCILMVVSFSSLAASSFFAFAPLLPLVIALLGLGAGLYTVGGVSLMMDMTSSEHTGLFVGAWTLIQALAKGPASLASGGLFNLFLFLGADAPQAYGAVFTIEALGVFLSIFFLARVAVRDFQKEVVTIGEVAFESMDG